MDEINPEELADLGLIDVDPTTLKASQFRPNSPIARTARVQERRTLVLNLRTKGVTASSIARVVREQGLGSEKYDEKDVSDDFAAAMKVYSTQARDTVRDLQTLEGHRLDYMYSRLHTGIAAGKPAAVSCGVAISKLRISLYGLSADFQATVEDEVNKELNQALDYLQVELSSDVYQQVLMALSGRNKADVNDRIETIEVESEESDDLGLEES